jgi:hypothetical protein
MGKSNAALPEWPEIWNDTPSGTSDGWPDFTLPNGQKLKEVIQQRRTGLQNAIDRAQSVPDSMDGGLGYAAGHYLAMARPHGPIDFKNTFKGRGDPDQLGKAGNFAYYAIGSGVLPDTVLDAGASAYNLYKSMIDSKNRHDISPNPDSSAMTVRDSALAYGAGIK